MKEPTMDKLEMRLDRLERENRWLKRIGALVGVGIAAVVLMGQARPSKVAKVIEAERFVLRDKDEKVRASLNVLSGNRYGLILYDKDEKPRLVLGHTPIGLGLSLLDKNGKVRSQLAYLPDGRSALSINDQDGKSRLLLGVDAGVPTIGLVDRNEVPRAILSVTSVSPDLSLFDKKGKVIWSVP